MEADNHERHFTDEQLAKELGVHPDAIHEWRCKGIGPKYVHVFGKVHYRQSDVLEWIAGGRNATSAHSRRSQPEAKRSDKEAATERRRD